MGGGKDDRSKRELWKRPKLEFLALGLHRTPVSGDHVTTDNSIYSFYFPLILSVSLFLSSLDLFPPLSFPHKFYSLRNFVDLTF